MAAETETETETTTLRRIEQRDAEEEKQDDDDEEEAPPSGRVSGRANGAGAESMETHLELEDEQVNHLPDTNQNAGLQPDSAVDSQRPAGLKELVVSYDFNLGTSRSLTVQVTDAQLHDQASLCPPSSQLSTNGSRECISSAAGPTVVGVQSLSAGIGNCPSVSKANQQETSKPIYSTVTPIVKRPISDGYNWRKYGQKQVKRPKGFRSYFKCTRHSCPAKKLELCDETGRILEVVMRVVHDHDPHGKDDRVRTSMAVRSPMPVSQSTGTDRISEARNDSDPSTSSIEHMQETAVPHARRPCPSGLDGEGSTPVKEEVSSEAEVKRGVKKNDEYCSDSPFKPGKKPKCVVHAAVDVGISADGYGWRKYGQKMVKGNPNPRNYYRCTSAGCSVRKHTETAAENTNAVIITYKGVHDHDMPVPKKRHGLPSAPLIAAAAPVGMNNLQAKKSKASEKQVTSSSQWSVGTERELASDALELGGEKAIESARTLLSIGFEINPC